MGLIFVGCVLLLHHVNFTQDYLWTVLHRFFNPYTTGFDQVIQKFAVGGFLFLSGYKLALSKKSSSIIDFAKRRIYRIYPLYFVALLLFSFTAYPYLTQEFPSIPNFIIHALCLQSVLPDLFQRNYHTVWFVSNLMCCYAAFLPLRQGLGLNQKLFTQLALLLAWIYLIRQIADLYGFRVMPGDFDLYLIFFTIGMFTSQPMNKPWVEKCRGWVMVPIILIFSLGFMGLHTQFPAPNLGLDMLKKLLVLASTIPLYYWLLNLFRDVNLSPTLAQGLNYVNEASFCVFLIHRSIWAMMVQVWPEKSYVQSLYILGLGIPLIVWLSHELQVFYNKQVLPHLP